MLTCILLKLQAAAPRWKAEPRWEDAGLSALQSCYQTALHLAICQGQLYFFPSTDGEDFLGSCHIWAPGFEVGAGRWLVGWGRGEALVQKVWGAAHKCNWSLGIFTWGLINMPLKHSRHICPTEQRQRQIITIRNFFFFFFLTPLDFNQQLTDKVSGCLGCLTLMWIDKALLSCYLQKARQD